MHINGSTILLNLGAEDFRLRVKDYATDKIGKTHLGQDSDLPLPSQNVGQIYERFATGGYYPSFKEGVHLHKLLDKIYLFAA